VTDVNVGGTGDDRNVNQRREALLIYDFEDSGFLGRDPTSLDEWFPKFRKILLSCDRAS
jgi:hypothetical protein